MAGQEGNCDYCSSYIPQDYAPDDMTRASVISILHHVLRENSQSRRQFNEWKSHMPYVPSDIFTYEDYDMASGRKHRGTKKHRGKKARGKTRHQRGGTGRKKVAQIMTLIVYTTIIYYGLPYVGAAVQNLEKLLVSSGLLPKLCSGLEEVAAILTPGDNVCRLRETAYNNMINGISASLVSLAAGWGYTRGNIWDTAKKDWGKLTDKFENMLETYQNNSAESIVSNTADIDYDNMKELEGLESARSLASIYMQELLDYQLDQELDMGVLNMFVDEPDSQDHYGPDYENYDWGEGRRRKMHRRRHTHRRSRRSKGRGKKKGCRTLTRHR